MGQERERWSSRPAFICAAVGSAVGLGNIWRFPSLAFAFNSGGGAFLIPYLLALFLVGIPMLLLELALGQVYQSGDAIAFGKMHPRLRGIGVASVYCGWMVVVYYCALIGWSLRCFMYAFKDPLPWADMVKESSGSWGWVVENVIGMDSDFLASENELAPTKMVWENLLCLVIVWVFVFLSLVLGPKWTGRFTYATMGLPVIVILALLCKTFGMEGADDGVKEYIGRWDLTALSEMPEQWSMAVSQIFFSLSLTFGIMTAYASYNKKNNQIVQDSLIIGLANSFFSIVAGFAVFGTMGHLAWTQGVSINKLTIGGPGLMFGTYPVGLLTGSLGEHWNRLLFITIFFLGIDSAFSLAEGVVTVLRDTKCFANTPRILLVGVICLVSLLCGIPYCLDAGLILLDAVDYYVNFVMLFVGFVQSFAAGWLYNVGQQADRVGVASTWGLLVNYNLAALVGAAAAFSIGGKTGCAVGFLFGLGVGAIGTTIACAVAKPNKGQSEKDLLWDLFFGNVEELRHKINNVVAGKEPDEINKVVAENGDEINKVVAENGQWLVPFAWSVLIKFFIPPVLLVLICGIVTEETADGKSKFGNYEGYPSGYQTIGVIAALLTVVIVGLGMVFPSAYSCLTFKDEPEGEESSVPVQDASAQDANAKEAPAARLDL